MNPRTQWYYLYEIEFKNLFPKGLWDWENKWDHLKSFSVTKGEGKKPVKQVMKKIFSITKSKRNIYP